MTSETKDLINRIEKLENRIAFQDDTIEQLNNAITQINLDNAMLKRQLDLLAEKMRSQKSSIIASEAEETPPPHY